MLVVALGSTGDFDLLLPARLGEVFSVHAPHVTHSDEADAWLLVNGISRQFVATGVSHPTAQIAFVTSGVCYRGW